MAYDEDGLWKPDEPAVPEVDYPDAPPETAAQYQQKTAAPTLEQVDYPDMPPDMAAQYKQQAAAPSSAMSAPAQLEQVDYPDMPEAEAIKIGLKKEPTLREQAYPEGRRGFGERVAAGWEGGFGKEPLGMSPETQQRFPMFSPFQPLVAGIDATLRAVPALAGAAAGAATSALESAPKFQYGLPDISPSIPGVTRLSRTEADRAQRDLKTIAEGALIEPMMGTAATRVPSVERPRAPWNPPPTSGVAEPPAYRPGVTPEGQYQFPVDAAHQPSLPLRGGQGKAPPRQLDMPLEGGGGPRGELPLGDEAAQRRQGQTAGSDAAPGVAQEPRPPTTEPVGDPHNKATLGDGQLEKGGENLNTRDYGKRTPAATGDASGVNVLKDGVDPTLSATLKGETTPTSALGTAAEPPAAAVRPPPEAPSPAPGGPTSALGTAAKPPAAGLLPEKQPFYEAAKAEAPNLPEAQLTHIANLAGGPKGAALMARNAARRMAEDIGAPAARVVETERAPVPAGTMELPPVEVKPPGVEPPPAPAPVQQFAPQEQFGGRAPPKVTPESRPIEPTGRPVSEGARAEVNQRLDQTLSAANPEAHLRETAARARELGLEGQARRIEAAAAEMERQRTVEIALGPGERSTGTLRQQQEGPLQRLRDFIADERGGGRITRKPVPAAVAKAQDAILDRIAPEPGMLDKLPGSKSEVRRTLMSAYQAAKDQLHPLREVEALGPKLSADESFYQAARKSKGLAERVEQILERSTYDIKTRQPNGKSLRDAIKGVENDAGFDAYMAAKRAISLDARGMKTGMSIPDANLVVSQTKKLYDQNFKDVIDFKNRNLDNLQKAGVLSADAVARMRAVNPEHIPFYRLLDKDSGMGQQLGAGLQVRDPIHRVKGSDKQILHPMDSIIKDTMVQTDIAEKNLVMQKLEDWITKNDPNGKYFPRKHDVHPVKVIDTEINKFLKEHGIADEVHDALTIFRKDAFRPDENSFRVFRDGKPRTYEITGDAPAALGKAINGMDQDTINTAIKIAAFPAKTLRTGATTTLEFIAKNIGRDNISAFINTKGFRPGYDMIKGAVSTYMKDAHYQQAAIEGGLNATMVAMDRNKALQMRPKDFIGQVSHVINPKNWLSVLQDISEFGENATRMGMYKRAIEQGKTPGEAAFIMREGTLDFQRIGGNKQVKAFNMITPFFNVSLEGLDRTVRAFKDNPLGTSLKVATAITLPSMLLWDHNKDDPRYQEMEWWRKDLFWNFTTNKWVNMSADDASRIEPALKRQGPDGSWQRNDGIIWSFPKPFEVGIIFGSVPERVADYLYRKDPKAFKDIWKTIVEGFTPSFIPQAIVPIAEQWGNKSLFRGRDLVPEYMKKLSPEEQYGTRTSEVAKWAGKQLSAFLPKGSSFGSPMVLDNYVQGYAGGLGKYVLDAMDKGLEMSGAIKPKNAPAATEADIYGLRAFVARSPGAGAQSIQNFYDIWADRKTSKADVSHFRRTGRPEDARAERQENAALQVAEGTHKQIGFLHERIRRVMRDENMTPVAKREAIDVAYLKMISAARYGVNKFNVRKEQLEKAR